MSICAIILAAGRGRRMGSDKALLPLGGATAIERVVANCVAAGVTEVVIVRELGAASLPAAVSQCAVVEVQSDGEMLDSIRAGLAALPESAAAALIFPVDYAMVAQSSIASVCLKVGDPAASVVLPLFGDRPGHPIGLSRRLFAEVDAASESLREVIAADRQRVSVVEVDDPWVRRDLDTPDDHLAAVAALRAQTGTVTAFMRGHRSRRAFHPDPVTTEQLEWIIDSARYASTSSFIQAYSVISVRDAERKAEVAKLCGDQSHIHQAPVFLAVCADLHKLDASCRRHDVSLRDAPLEAFVESLIDASLLGQNILLAAESEGLGGCMIGAARQKPRELAALLSLPRHVFVAFGLILGRPADDPPPRGRMPLAAVLHEEQYGSGGIDAALDAADDQMRAWSKTINAMGGYNGRKVSESKGWTDRMAAKWSRDFGLREALAEHLRAMGFGLQ